MPRTTFEAMLEVLEQGQARKTKPGRPSKLALADQLLLALSYWREYRTLFHIAAEYGLHESSAQRIVCRVEDCLSASGRFSLSPRDTLLKEGPRNKARRGKPLEPWQKRFNRSLARMRIRIRVEHVIGALKRFRILAERYRSWRCRFGQRFNLIAGLYNHGLALRSK